MTDDPPSRLNPDAPRRFAMSGREVDYFIDIYCSDKGQHKPMVLTTARREMDGSHGMNHALRWFAPPSTARENEELDANFSYRSYVFRCPLCRRNPKISGDQWWEIVDRMAIEGFSALDLSMLEF
ncbi:hypothetical protein [Nocardia sp. NBC_01388]|uniref:hypothetical protein n=1 Tax=Nocardia sp. NBC_01388 TaxID=2903596 RepID=UPI00324B8A63